MIQPTGTEPNQLVIWDMNQPTGLEIWVKFLSTSKGCSKHDRELPMCLVKLLSCFRATQISYVFRNFGMFFCWDMSFLPYSASKGSWLGRVYVWCGEFPSQAIERGEVPKSGTPWLQITWWFNSAWKQIQFQQPKPGHKSMQAIPTVSSPFLFKQHFSLQTNWLIEDLSFKSITLACERNLTLLMTINKSQWLAERKRQHLDLPIFQHIRVIVTTYQYLFIEAYNTKNT